MIPQPIVASNGPVWAVPGDTTYSDATAGYNLAAEVSPRYALTATSVDHVQHALAEAARRGVRVRVQSTGHAADAAFPFAEELLVQVLIEGDVDINVEAKTATIPAGKTWGEVVAVTAPHGLVPLHGSSAQVGAVGYLLRGGVSFYGRKYGVASNSIVSITLVVADGSLVTVDHSHDRELFDALRGGGGGFGIVVSVTISLFAVESVVTGAAFWPVSEAEFLLRSWEHWAQTAPNAASTSFRVMNLPPLPGIPPQLTNGPVVCIDGAILDDPERSGWQMAEDLLSPLRAHAEPILDTWHIGAPSDVPLTHMDPAEPSPFRGDHQMLERLGEDGRKAILSIAGTEAGSSLAVVELRQLGGALGMSDDRGGAVNSLSGAYATFSAGIALGPNTLEGIAAQLAALRVTLTPWDTGFTVPTYVDRFDAPQKSFEASVAEHVDTVRRRVDPFGTFNSDVVAGARM